VFGPDERFLEVLVHRHREVARREPLGVELARLAGLRTARSARWFDELLERGLVRRSMIAVRLDRQVLAHHRESSGFADFEMSP
jgi:hypothetical protein